MKLSLLYIGADDAFRQTISHSAQDLDFDFSCMEWPPNNVQTTDKHPPHCKVKRPTIQNLNKHRLIIIDGDTTELTSKLQTIISNSEIPHPLYLIAISEPKDRNNRISDWLWNQASDLIIKPIRAKDLSKKLAFCHYHLKATLPGEDSSNIDKIRQENQQYRTYNSQLQQRLNQIDSDLNARSEVLEKINRISILSRQINSLDLQKIARVCIEEIPDLISARFASLYQYHEKTNELNLLGHNHPYMIDQKVSLSEHTDTPMAQAIRQKKLLLIQNLTKWVDQSDLLINRIYVRNYESNSCIIAPLMSGDDVLGVLNLADHGEDHPFDYASDGPPVELLCEIIGSAMSNIRLYDEVREKARTDSMTGLVNHQTFYDELDKEVKRSKRYGGSLSLIMIDLDNLKEINDNHGHRVGDAVLIHVAHQIEECIRTTDIAARYGGDEFSIILPNTSVGEALVVAQRISELVSGQAVSYDEDSYYASVSIGMGQYRKGATIAEFMNESDVALFEAKSAGKNQVHVFEAAGK